MERMMALASRIYRLITDNGLVRRDENATNWAARHPKLWLLSLILGTTALTYALVNFDLLLSIISALFMAQVSYHTLDGT